MYFKNNKFLSHLMLIFPPALITGPFLPDLILSISSIYFLFKLSIDKNLNFLNNDFFKFFAVFYIFIVVRSLFSEEILFSLKNTFFYFRFVIFAYLIKYLIINEKNFLKNFIFVLFGVLLIISLDAIAEYFLNSHWLFDKSSYPEFQNNNRISGLFDDEFILGGFILSFMAISIFFFNEFFEKNKSIKVIYLFFSFLIFMMAIIISGERVSFVKFIILLMTVTLFKSFFGSWKNQFIVFLMSIVLIFSTIYFQPKVKERLIFHTINLIFEKDNTTENAKNLFKLIQNKEFKDLKITYFSSEHRDHALISLKMLNENKLFGQGIKMFRFYCGKKEYYINERSCSTHSHGILLTFMSELGIIGLTFLILIYFFLIKSIFKSYSNTNRITLISIFIYLLPVIPSGYFFNNFFSMVLYTMVGIYLGDKKRSYLNKND